MKKIIIILTSLIVLFIIYINVESKRLENNSESTPLIVFKLDSTKTEETYYSLGFKLVKKYSNNHELIGEECYLFNNNLWWAWIE